MCRQFIIYCIEMRRSSQSQQLYRRTRSRDNKEHDSPKCSDTVQRPESLYLAQQQQIHIQKQNSPQNLSKQHNKLKNYLQKQSKHLHYRLQSTPASTDILKNLSKCLQKRVGENAVKQIKRILISYFYSQPASYFQEEKSICQVFQFIRNQFCTLDCDWIGDFKVWIAGFVWHVQKFVAFVSSNSNNNMKHTLKLQQVGNQRIYNQAVQLKVQNPLCPVKGCQFILQDRKCKHGKHCIVICNKCQWTAHDCPKKKKIQFTDNLIIKPEGKFINSYPVSSLHPTRQENNIKQTLINQGYEFIRSQIIIKGIPDNIVTRYPVITGKARELIYENRKKQQYLPLLIKKSNIKGAGLGVFATKNFNHTDMLVCSYMGEIGIGSHTPNQRNNNPNDSIFTLGWLGYEILIMAPNKFSNVGRYINYNKPEYCNLKPNLCLLERKQNDYEIAVFLTNVRTIRAGEELFYNYGPDYSTS